MKIKTSLLITCLIAVISVAQSPYAYAQEENQQKRPVLYWANFGIGTASGNSLSARVFTANVNVNTNYGVLGLRYFVADDAGVHGFWDVTNGLKELSIMYGYSFQYGMFNMTGSAGLGYQSGEKRGPSFDGLYAYDVFTFPAQVTVSFQPVPFIGLGINFYGSYNSEQNYQGTAVFIQLGRLR